MQPNTTIKSSLMGGGASNPKSVKRMEHVLKRIFFSILVSSMLLLPMTVYANDPYPPGNYMINLNQTTAAGRLDNVGVNTSERDTVVYTFNTPTRSQVQFTDSALQDKNVRGLVLINGFSYDFLYKSLKPMLSSKGMRIVEFRSSFPMTTWIQEPRCFYNGGFVGTGYNSGLYLARTSTTEFLTNKQSTFRITTHQPDYQELFTITDTKDTSNTSSLICQTTLTGINVNITVLQDNTAVGRIEQQVQAIPNQLNTFTTQMNNKPTQIVSVPQNNPGPTLAKLGLPTNLTVDGVYTTSYGTRVQINFYTPPTNIDQLNLS